MRAQDYLATTNKSLDCLIENGRLKPFDLVIIDLNMPNFEGREEKYAGLALLERIKAESPHLPVITNSAWDEVETAKTCLGKGASDYFVKGRNDEMLAKIRQVLVNVIGNAQKYSPDGGPISIRLHAEDAGHPNAVAVEVGDRGVGMETHQLQRIFDRFYRADTSGKIPGSGLGMSIVKEIVDLHGGKVEVMSEPGKGTRVVVWFPSLQPKREGTE